MNLSHLFFPLTEVILDFISPSSGHFIEVLFQACVELLSQPLGWLDNEMHVREGQRASRRPSGSPSKLAQRNVLNLILKRSMISLLIFFFLILLLSRWMRACFSRSHIMDSKLSPHPPYCSPVHTACWRRMEAWPKGWMGPARSWPLYEHSQPWGGLSCVSLSINQDLHMAWSDFEVNYCGLLDLPFEAIILGFGVCSYLVLL